MPSAEIANKLSKIRELEIKRDKLREELNGPWSTDDDNGYEECRNEYIKVQEDIENLYMQVKSEEKHRENMVTITMTQEDYIALREALAYLNGVIESALTTPLREYSRNTLGTIFRITNIFKDKDMPVKND